MDKPLFEADQVLTFYDIYAIRNGYVFQYEKLPWYAYQKKFMFRVGIGVCNELLHWLSHGKPEDGANYKEEKSHGV